MTEAAPQSSVGKGLLKRFALASEQANPELLRLALKMATGAGKTTVTGQRHHSADIPQPGSPATMAVSRSANLPPA